MTRLLLETEGPGAAIAQFQQGLSAIADGPPAGAGPAGPVPGRLAAARPGLPIAAMKHLELAARWAGDQDKDRVDRAVDRQLSGQPATLGLGEEPVSAPAGAGGGDRRLPRVVRAGDGLGRGGPLGLGRLGVRAALRRLVRRRRSPTATAASAACGSPTTTAAVAALRRYTARTGPTRRRGRPRGPLPASSRAAGAGETVEFVHLTWPIRDRAGLLRALEASPYFEPGPERPIHRDDPDSSPTERFFLLDRPRIEARPGLTRRDIPIVRGRGDRRRGRRRAGDLRRQPARPPDRPVHGRGPRDDPAGAPADQGDREGAPVSCWP